MIEINLTPYMPKIWDHIMDNWDVKEYPVSSRTISTLIWESLEKEYGVRRIAYFGRNRNLAIFPDEKSYIWFLLRWA